MKPVSRTALAFTVGIALAVTAGVVGKQLAFGSWGFTGLAVAVVLVVSLIDREGFYGTERERRAPPRP